MRGKEERSKKKRIASRRRLSDVYRLLCDLPDFLFAATVPCLFIPLAFGLGARPFEDLHDSLRDCLGPCVDTRVDFDEDATPSTSMVSGSGKYRRRKTHRQPQVKLKTL